MKKLLLVLLASLVMPTEPANAQAYCALRDPAKSIYDLVPGSDAYRSYVGTISEATRVAVGERLPFTLHFNELGRHTLYTALRKKTPVGFVHVRSEQGRWGLVEVAWSFDMDLRIRGFEFQRCRSRARATVESGAFHDSLLGLNLAELRNLVTDDGNAVKPGALPAGTDPELALAVLRCGLKTLVVTQEVWDPEVGYNMATARARNWFSNAAQVAPLDPKTTWPNVNSELAKRVTMVGIKRPGSFAYVLQAEAGAPNRLLLRTAWQVGEMSETLWWSFSDGNLMNIDCEGGWPDADTKQYFESALAAGLPHDGCSTPVELVTCAARDLGKSLSTATTK